MGMLINVILITILPLAGIQRRHGGQIPSIRPVFQCFFCNPPTTHPGTMNADRPWLRMQTPS